MKKYQQIILSLMFLLMTAGSATATSLDELYRDIVRSDNQGYLPMFVKNRSIPDVLSEDEALLQTKEAPKDVLKEPIPGPVKLTNDRKAQEEALKAEQKKWDDTLQAVRENRVTPLELEEITLRVNRNDPKAVEILAWMNARGVGINVNLMETFQLDQKAATLNVSKASENAVAVYKSMNREQREQLNKFKN